ncbi:MAG: filamentous hemagglutinin N-terminal domain-containing protein [Nitrospinae bacterium]|nr:filamentous hemagglutinin N-terminal domain-containing protein [Nitrospinota bacterium]
MAPGWAYALPTEGEIVSGSGSIEIELTAPQDLTIQQDSQLLITNWQDFSIGSEESVTFNQPNTSAVALNRVIGTDPSLILGNLSADGQVFLVNPSGVLFGKDAMVDVHGLLATTLSISNEDFLNGNYQFNQDPDRSLAAVINNGTLNATRYIGLAAPAVENNGSLIVADLGSVALASGTAATLDFNGDGLISFAVTGEVSGVVTDSEGDVLEDRIHNSGHIRANGGQVLLTARSAGDVIGNVVNHSGLIEARTVEGKDGKIILSGSPSGVVNVNGVLHASNVVVTTGDVETRGGDRRSGNIEWNADLDYVGTGTLDLTLSAHNDIVFNASIFTSEPPQGDRLNLNLTADSDRNGAGRVEVEEGALLFTNNGDINIMAHDLDLEGDLNSGTSDVLFTLSDGGNLILTEGDPNGKNIGGDDLQHITAENLVLTTDGNINVKGITEENTAGIGDSVILISGHDINFEDAPSTFPALQLSAVNDINVNTDITTTKGDFIAVADSDDNTIGDFNVAPGVVITSARDIDVTAPNINADDDSFNETRNLILNGNVVGDEPEPEPSPVLDADSIQQGSLGTFLTDFLKNGGPSC